MLPPELQKWKDRIETVAKSLGLDFFETIFEIVDYKTINALAAKGGFPVRYPHWRFGMEYERLSKSYEYGLSKIYEMVINTDPCYAYLMEGNTLLDQKLVMAHVYAHCDFFKNNVYFAPTDRKMIDTMANHAVKIRRFIDRYGYEIVEKFIDVALSLENLIDINSLYQPSTHPEEHEDLPTPDKVPLLRYEREYMRDYINPPDFVESMRKKIFEEWEQKKRQFPRKPEQDILKFLIDYAPIDDWQKEILSIIRSEAYYFAPQGLTKTMNEGWATYWHSEILTKYILDDSEIIDFADKHSGVIASLPFQYNPYKVGLELFRDIKERWDKGQFGAEWESCDDIQLKKNWDKKTNLGLQKIFEVRKLHNDVTFIDEFLTEDFCIRHKLFVYKYNPKTQQFEVDSTDFQAIKARLLFQLTNFGQPIIKIIDANFNNRNELYLKHSWEGVDLDPIYMAETLKNLFKIWKRPVHLETVLSEKHVIVTFNGDQITTNENKQLILPTGQNPQ